MNFKPSYIKLLESGILHKRAEEAYNNLISCTSCPRDCKTDRINGEIGICTSGNLPVVSSYTPHFGEEPVLSGTKGAGNVFIARTTR
jgi:putative pyruvate formate lyase activating enzyme